MKKEKKKDFHVVETIKTGCRTKLIFGSDKYPEFKSFAYLNEDESNMTEINLAIEMELKEYRLTI